MSRLFSLPEDFVLAPAIELGRRCFFLRCAALLLTGTGTGFWLRLESENLEVVHQTLPLKGLHRPLRLVQLSDWHLSPVVRTSFLRRAIDRALSQKPDLVCVTGDFTTDGISDWQELLDCARSLASRVPTFAVLGNHDGRPGAANPILGPTRRCLEEAGVSLLENRQAVFEASGQRVRLVGTGDLWHGPFDPPRAFARASEPMPTVLLTHNPDARAAVLTHDWDLCLCGHTHGGQINLPGMYGRFAPVVDRRFIAGAFAIENRLVYINRGLGTIGGIRWCARPEITVFDLQPGI